MLGVLVLVCSLSMPGPECQRGTAVMAMDVPEPSPTVWACQLSGQAYLANAGIAIGPGFYVKVQCIPPTSIGRGNVG